MNDDISIADWYINALIADWLTIVLYHAGTSNIFLTLEVVNVSSPVDAQLQCIFLSGFNTSTHCAVWYGTDPTYVNLPFSAESNETGTNGDSVSVVLREQLNSSTVYYYNVSADDGDVTVTVLGTFTTPHYSKYCEPSLAPKPAHYSHQFNNSLIGSENITSCLF